MRSSATRFALKRRFIISHRRRIAGTAGQDHASDERAFTEKEDLLLRDIRLGHRGSKRTELTTPYDVHEPYDSLGPW